MNDRISVARMLELGVAPTWQEAVAIALEATLQAAGSRISGRPVRLDTDVCVLTSAGDVVLEIESATASPDDPQQLLRALLVGVEAPPELVDVAYGSSPESLTDDLAEFSRPNRRAEIAAVVSRALAADRQAAASEPPATAPLQPAREPQPSERLSDLLQRASGRPRHAPTPPTPRLRPSARRASEVVAVVAVTAAVASAAWTAWSLKPATAVSTTPSTSESATIDEAPGPSEPDPRWVAAGQRTADIPLPRRAPRSSEAPPGRDGAPPGAAEPGPSPSLATIPALPTIIAPRAPGGPANSEPRGGPSPSAPADNDLELNAEAFDTGVVYSGTSVGVTPPVMVQPRMPRSSFPDPTEQLDGAYVEVLVNEQGAVDGVRLRGRVDSADSVRHGMMLSAAKAWYFEPARRNGRAVRYVVRVLVTQ